MDLKPNFTYPKINAKIKVIGDGFNSDWFGYYVGKTESGQLKLDIDPNNLLPEDRKYVIINVYDKFEIL